jgi:hypothetical protein
MVISQPNISHSGLWHVCPKSHFRIFPCGRINFKIYIYWKYIYSGITPKNIYFQIFPSQKHVEEKEATTKYRWTRWSCQTVAQKDFLCLKSNRWYMLGRNFHLAVKYEALVHVCMYLKSTFAAVAKCHKIKIYAPQ